MTDIPAEGDETAVLLDQAISTVAKQITTGNLMKVFGFKFTVCRFVTTFSLLAESVECLLCMRKHYAECFFAHSLFPLDGMTFYSILCVLYPINLACLSFRIGCWTVFYSYSFHVQILKFESRLPMRCCSWINASCLATTTYAFGSRFLIVWPRRNRLMISTSSNITKPCAVR